MLELPVDSCNIETQVWNMCTFPYTFSLDTIDDSANECTHGHHISKYTMLSELRCQMCGHVQAHSLEISLVFLKMGVHTYIHRF